MKKKLIFLLCILLPIVLAGCTIIQGIFTESIPSDIPTNASVNTAWGGDMCEANGAVYYVTDADDKEKIVCMEPDGSDLKTVTTGEYNYISELTSDGDNFYFVASSGTDDTDTIYRLPLSGGEEQEAAEGHDVFALQNANGRLYWEDLNMPLDETTPDQTTTVQIKSVDPDGSDLQTLYSLTIPSDDVPTFVLLVADGNIYYATDAAYINDDDMPCDIYRMDLNGKNTVKLNNGKLGTVDEMFYDQGKLNFLMEHFDGNSDIGFWDSLETLDDTGKTNTIIKEVDYYPQDFSGIAYCGISNNMFYYFVITHINESTNTNDSSVSIKMDLRQFDLKTKRNSVILNNIEMGDPAVGKISSVRGKSIKNDGTYGLYILGNDIYFATNALP